MNNTLDGQFQRYSVESGEYIRDHFFGPDPRLREVVSHLSDDELRNLPRGGHDYRKLYAAYKAATENLGSGRPTVILAKTIKGWTLGPGFEGRNSTHQIKKMTKEQLVGLRDRLYLHDEIPESAIQADDPPYFRPSHDSIEYQYMMERRKALDGSLPKRSTRTRRPISMPSDKPFEEMRAGSGKQEVSTTMGFTRLLRNLCRDDAIGPRIVPIIPDEARTFGMDALFRELHIYAAQGQKYESVDHDLLLSYSESKKGQILEEGITEAGSMSSFIAAATSYATRGIPMVPFYTFYSMFGFQRVGDLIWQAADSRARGFLLGATAGRTTLHGEGLQHQDGHSLRPRQHGAGVPGVRPGVRVRGGRDRASRARADVRTRHARRGPRRLLLPHALQRELRHATGAGRSGGRRRHHARALPLGARSAGTGEAGDDPVLRIGAGDRPPRRRRARRALQHVGRAVVGDELQAPPRGGTRGRTLEPPPPGRGSRGFRSSPNCSTRQPGPITAVTDFMKAVPDQISRFVPRDRPFNILGTDGMGRSDTREALRRHFEIDAGHVVVATLTGLVRSRPRRRVDGVGRDRAVRHRPRGDRSHLRVTGWSHARHALHHR